MRTKKITLQFHYGPNEITPTIRVYVCPPKPEYGCEIKFNEDENVVDVVSGCGYTGPNRTKRSVCFLLADESSRTECIEIETLPRSLGPTQCAGRMPKGVQEALRWHRSYAARTQNGHGKSDFEFQPLWSATEFGCTFAANGSAGAIRKTTMRCIECISRFHCTVSRSLCKWPAKCHRIDGNLRKMLEKHSNRLYRAIE